ncbi:MAG: hypothetical protein S0880_11305 [Actinomycetota bacterium]|nr:hypothetical protein [Actinomycetota bacterium]
MRAGDRTAHVAVVWAGSDLLPEGLAFGLWDAYRDGKTVIDLTSW